MLEIASVISGKIYSFVVIKKVFREESKKNYITSQTKPFDGALSIELQSDVAN